MNYGTKQRRGEVQGKAGNLRPSSSGGMVAHCYAGRGVTVGWALLMMSCLASSSGGVFGNSESTIWSSILRSFFRGDGPQEYYPYWTGTRGHADRRGKEQPSLKILMCVIIQCGFSHFVIVSANAYIALKCYQNKRESREGIKGQMPCC